MNPTQANGGEPETFIPARRRYFALPDPLAAPERVTILETGYRSVRLAVKLAIMLPQFPAEHLAELEAAAKASGWPKDLLVFANTLPDLRKLTGCSALLVESCGSARAGRFSAGTWTRGR